MNRENSTGISVIMPVYNVEKYLKKAVETILSQNFSNYEIILVNDGSSDKSGEVCDRLAREHERIIVLHKKNGGVSSARNAALNIAGGKYIYFMDPDDYVQGELLKENYELAEKYDCDQVVFGFSNIICDPKTGKKIKKIDCYHNMNGKYDFSEFKQIYKDHLLKVNQVVWNRIYSREHIGNTRFSDDLSTAEDAVFNVELIKKGFKNIYYNNSVYYMYIIRKNSLMNRYNPNRFSNEMIINDGIKELTGEWGMTDEFENVLSCKYIETVLSEYGNMNMHDCNLTLKEIKLLCMGFCNDERICTAINSVSVKDMKSMGLKILFVLTKNKHYIAAYLVKKSITPISILGHKIMYLLGTVLKRL